MMLRTGWGGKQFSYSGQTRLFGLVQEPFRTTFPDFLVDSAVGGERDDLVGQNFLSFL